MSQFLITPKIMFRSSLHQLLLIQQPKTAVPSMLLLWTLPRMSHRNLFRCVPSWSITIRFNKRAWNVSTKDIKMKKTPQSAQMLHATLLRKYFNLMGNAENVSVNQSLIILLGELALEVNNVDLKNIWWKAALNAQKIQFKILEILLYVWEIDSTKWPW